RQAVRGDRPALQGAAGRLHEARPHREPHRRQRAHGHSRAGGEEREDRGAEGRGEEEGRGQTGSGREGGEEARQGEESEKGRGREEGVVLATRTVRRRRLRPPLALRAGSFWIFGSA